jgi:hypothetical protein
VTTTDANTAAGPATTTTEIIQPATPTTNDVNKNDDVLGLNDDKDDDDTDADEDKDSHEDRDSDEHGDDDRDED